MQKFKAISKIYGFEDLQKSLFDVAHPQLDLCTQEIDSNPRRRRYRILNSKQIFILFQTTLHLLLLMETYIKLIQNIVVN